MSWRFTRDTTSLREALESAASEVEVPPSDSSEWARLGSSSSHDTSLTTTSAALGEEEPPGAAEDSADAAAIPLGPPGAEVPSLAGLVWPAWRREESGASLATSAQQFADPGQTLIFFDWDDTLFPYTELFERQRLQLLPDAEEQRAALPPALGEDLAAWREALQQYLAVACSLSESCTILTNARRPWVDLCIDRFAPELRELLDRGGGPRVVYADEALAGSSPTASSQGPVLGGSSQGIACSDSGAAAAVGSASPRGARAGPAAAPGSRTAAKLAAMEQEAARFYSRYPEQTWKNILSLGDMKYEHDALQALGLGRASPPRERLRTKAILLPGGPSLSELTLRLQFSRLMLPAYVRFNGNIDLDLRAAIDPLQAIARALGIPRLGELPFPRHAWGRTPLPEGQVAAEALVDVALTMHETLEEEGGRASASAGRGPSTRPARAAGPLPGAWRTVAEGVLVSAAGQLLASAVLPGDVAAAEASVDLCHSLYALSVAVLCSFFGTCRAGRRCASSLAPWAEQLATTMYLRSCGHFWTDSMYVGLVLASGGRPPRWRRRLLRCAAQSATNVACLVPGPGSRQRIHIPCCGYLAEAASLPIRLAGPRSRARRGVRVATAVLVALKVANLWWCWRVIHGARRQLSRCWLGLVGLASADGLLALALGGDYL